MSEEATRYSAPAEAPPPASGLLQMHEALTARRGILEQRLEDGYRRIEAALDQGADVESWETFWVDLLAEYESVCDNAAAA